MFKNREEAGALLADQLTSYSTDPHAIVIGLPRGGVPVAFEVAEKLQLPLDIVCPRKIGSPFNPEYAIGAITETGEGTFNEWMIEREGITDEYINRTVERQKLEAQRRLHLYRGELPPRDFLGKTILLIDDGLATGSTMKAALISLQKQGIAKIIVAVPVSPIGTAQEIAAMVDGFVCLQTPENFYAVGQFYQEFSQTDDQEVIALLKKKSGF